MSLDLSRLTFNPWNDYADVVSEQGRPQTDADWNEWGAELSRRQRAGTLDILGHAVYPATTPNAFKIAVVNSDLRIGLGRMYVDGILVENHGPLDKNTPWDPALAELSNTPQPGPSTPQPLDGKNSILFTKQPYDPGVSVPVKAGDYVAYLDVWQRARTYIEDSSLIDVAIGVDTSGRIQTAWRVTLAPVPTASTIDGTVTKGTFLPGEQVTQKTSNASAALIGGVPGSGPMVVGVVSGGTPVATGSNINWVGQTSGAEFTPTAVPAPVVWGCDTLVDALPPAASSGRISTQLYPSTPSGPCCLTTGSGYTGPENQFYRIEIHTSGGAGGANATFKWSRENASVQTKVTAIASAKNSLGNPSSSLTVQSLGRDQVLGFSAGDWIEITDTSHDDNCNPGELYKIDSVDVPTTSIILTTPLSANFSSTSLTQNAYTRLIRWDQSGEVQTISGGTQSPYYNLDAPSSSSPGAPPNGCGGIPIPLDGEVVLENGVAISFALAIQNGSFQPMDYWNFTARTADGSIETLKDSPPRGIAHHYATLSLVTVDSSGTPTASDCRTGWPPTVAAGECGCCCSVTVGEGAKYGKIQEAVDALARSGGEVCVLAGTYYEDVLIRAKRGITIRGCGERTIVCSPSLQPGATAKSGGGGATLSGLPAVFTIVGSEDIAIEALRIRAGRGDVGVLMDRPSKASQEKLKLTVTRDRDIRLADLEVAASTAPAIAARDVTALTVRDSRIAMADVTSLYPAVYLAGDQIRFERNDVRIESDDGTISRIISDPGEDREVEVKVDAGETEANLQKVDSGITVENAGSNVNTDPAASLTARKLPIGGVQVGGPSCDVWIIENTIEGGSRNGITLGNIVYLDSGGHDTGTVVGVVDQPDDQCCTTATGSVPPTTGSGDTQKTLVAGGLIKNLGIVRNKICKTGMYGIGPVGFWDLNSHKEIISLVNVLIAQNILVDTLFRELAFGAKGASAYGYGAIGLPDVQNLIVRDNIITDYGYAPGAEVCGIYVYHGEGIEIDRNKIRESRDLRAVTDPWQSYGGERAGIYIELATPPTLDTSSGAVWIKAMEAINNETKDAFRNPPPDYAPGCSALRIVNNNVRVAYGLALSAFGSGPFAILANHLSTGGVVSTNSRDLVNYKIDDDEPNLSAPGTPTGALTVAILNMGVALETVAVEILTYAEISKRLGRAAAGTLSKPNTLSVTGGTVQFADNTCQLMAQLSRVHGYCSVGILTLDNLLFTDNVLWVNGKKDTVTWDAALIGWSVQALSNRLQESLSSVIASGYSLGLANVTAQNISTHCFLSLGLPTWWIPLPNVVLDFAGCPVYGSFNLALEGTATQ
jgi:Family of unknown function (DUF6519)